ncbi:MAG TPA: cupin domain-containing protein [Acidimicrobiia bacterium]|nr:cupin domain-containing protein [Acidimicrobiia bacterium]
MNRHIVHRAEDATFEVPAMYGNGSRGLGRWSLVDHTSPAVHTGFGVCELSAGGEISSHVHSFEESFHITGGEVVLDTPEASARLVPGDYGVIPLGVPHRWRNTGDATARWADFMTPQPRPEFDYDTYLTPFADPADAKPIDVRDPRCRSFGHIEPDNMDPAKQTQNFLAVSASMRTALLVYSGISLKMMVDSDLGGQLGTMFMVQYEPNGLAGAHDHPFEEVYLVIEGEVDAVFDGVSYRLGPGDVGFAGVGSVHQFSNPADVPVRWLETQAPQPPARHSYRFARDWKYLGDVLAKE